MRVRLQALAVIRNYLTIHEDFTSRGCYNHLQTLLALGVNIVMSIYMFQILSAVGWTKNAGI